MAASSHQLRGAVVGFAAAGVACYVAARVLKRLREDIYGRKSKVVVVLGGQWGDEGKGKLVDILAQDAQVCARFNGGANAGHTLVVEGKKYAFHLLPCGMINRSAKNLIGNGVVVHIPTLLHELEQLKTFDPNALSRLFISDRAQVLLDTHRNIDGLIEAEKSGSATGSLGTTKRGIGPCYASKVNRNGIRFADLLDPDTLATKMRDLYRFQAKHYAGALTNHDQEDEIKRHVQYAKLLAPQIVDSLTFVHEEIEKDSRLLIEGANAALLDIDFGTFPFVTSSSTTVGGVCTGLGLAPRKIGCVIGVVKAYTTRVGAGPFPTELSDSVGKHLLDVGHEYGTTTGRPRRCGWLDIQVVKYAACLNGYDSINITKLDVLTGVKELKIGVSYSLHGKKLPPSCMPAGLEDLGAVNVEYITLPGWNEDISKCTSFSQLPTAARAYLKTVQDLCGIPISWVGLGPDREDMIAVSI
mmetsp:Transcript_13782/g.36959  ORF Transcript_13782/g.36959 Transcript_13782/m.36959 type:complete len:470 (-) Transcript_13782:246-1655(-)|eukprot:CAMPEP_0185187668 /NCGR_PEP_ID=MMETSP1140-20130426/4884_1 /TAXON_ID=298111 /ORGANISM="Pavlova sp., Strain CCMP459" /LENGTH=469 /DNA_ID=CAMNT_0027754083 /DNA_START=29 /DNA_END=1438 /DNA_ORIENTATION=-